MKKASMSSRLFWGFMFLLMGVLALMQNYGYWDINMEKNWPIFLVMMGFWMMLHRQTHPHPYPHRHAVDGEPPAHRVTRKRNR